VLHYTRLERLARNKHSSLLGPFVNYGDYEVAPLWGRLWPYPQTWARLERLARDKYTSLLGTNVSYTFLKHTVPWPKYFSKNLPLLIKPHIFLDVGV
jgi:hypothetical protein